MKRFVVYISICAGVALAVKFAVGLPFWTILILLSAAYGINEIRKTNATAATLLTIATVAVVFGTWGWQKVWGEIPVTSQSMPVVKLLADLKIAMKLNTGLAEAQTALYEDQARRDRETADNVAKLAKAGDLDGAIRLMTDEKSRRNKIYAAMDNLSRRPEKISSTSSAISPTTKSVIYAPTTTGKVLNIELKPGEIYVVDDVKKDQRWRYTAFNGAFDHRVDKGDGRDCWKEITNNKPWIADVDGKLELRAGNTPVNITVNVL